MAVEKFYVTGGSVLPQSDWAQTNSTASDFIKNKPTSIIEKTMTAEWNTATTPAVTFDIAALGYTAYKIADIVPTKEQIVAANWAVSSSDGQTTHDVTVSESDVMIEDDNIVIFQMSSAPNLRYAVCYNTGDLIISYSGVEIPVAIPETGVYQLWAMGETLPATIFGSMSYDVSEEVNFIQPNWEQTDATQPDYIKNKPDLSNLGGGGNSGGSGVSVQSDWEQNDETQPDYIKNRPFGMGDPEIQEVLPTTTLPFVYTTDMGMFVFERVVPKEYVELWNSEWNTAVVTWDGVDYICSPQDVMGIKAIGNVGLMMGGAVTDEPFILAMGDASVFGSNMCIIYDVATVPGEDVTDGAQIAHNIKLSAELQTVKKLDPKFIDSIEWDKINDKPFYTIAAGTVISEATVNCDSVLENPIYYTTVDTIAIVNGARYMVEFDGISYLLTANNDQIYSETDDTIFMFVNNEIPGSTIVASLAGEHTYRISANTEIIQKLDSKYLPDNIGGGSSLPESTSSDNGKVLTVGSDGTAVWQTPASGLPDVTSSDNGKVLTVSSGTWVATEAPSSLPEVTTDDNGKFLRVVDGVWAAQVVPNGEEATF